MSESEELSPADVVAVVPAGGRGERLGRVLTAIPKPMAPAAGRPFVEWVVRFLGARGIRRVVLAVGHLAQVIEAHFRGGPVPGVSVSCIREEAPLGTAGALANAVARSGLRPPAWLVCNGDSLALDRLDRLFAVFNRPGTDAAMLGLRLDQPSRYGTLELDSSGMLRAFVEKRAAGGSAMVNAGVYLMREALLSRFPARSPSSLESDVFPFLLSQGSRIAVAESAGPFLDIGTEATLPLAGEFISRNASWFLQD